MKFARVSQSMFIISLVVLGGTSGLAQQTRWRRAAGWALTLIMLCRLPMVVGMHRPFMAGVTVPDEALPATNSWNGCGVYHYWNGEQCVDARDVAPTIATSRRRATRRLLKQLDICGGNMPPQPFCPKQRRRDCSSASVASYSDLIRRATLPEEIQ